MDISFDDRTKKTAVYVKMDTPKQLLLSEGACRQLGISRLTIVSHEAKKKQAVRDE